MKAPLVFLLAAAAAYGASDPRLVGLLMPDAKVIAGLQVAECQNMPFGQFLLKQIPVNAGLDNFVAATGFDPRTDLAELAAASAGDNRWLIVGRGVFQATRIAGLAELSGATVTQYRGVDLIAGPANGGRGARARGANPGGAAPNGTTPNGASGAVMNGVAFLDSSTVLIGEVTLIKSAIDRRASGTVFNGPLAVKAQEVSGSNQAWAATFTPLSEVIPGLAGVTGASAPQANLLQAITGVSVGLRLGASDVTLKGEAVTRSDKDAQALVDVVHFLMSMAQANRANPQGGNVATLADSASVTAKGASMLLTVTVPEQQLEQLFPTQDSATPQGRPRKISSPGAPAR
jgi:hypothetical protein